MNINVKVEKTFDITGLTETQAQDLLDVCLQDDERITMDIRDPAIGETLSALRQALLTVSVTPTRKVSE